MTHVSRLSEHRVSWENRNNRSFHQLHTDIQLSLQPIKATVLAEPPVFSIFSTCSATVLAESSWLLYFLNMLWPQCKHESGRCHSILPFFVGDESQWIKLQIHIFNISIFWGNVPYVLNLLDIQVYEHFFPWKSELASHLFQETSALWSF